MVGEWEAVMASRLWARAMVPATLALEDTAAGAAASSKPGYNGVGYPTCVYCPDAKYPEEARKAKSQGVVQLQIVVSPDGRATDIQVVRGPGLGLDEQADCRGSEDLAIQTSNGPRSRARPHTNHH